MKYMAGWLKYFNQNNRYLKYIISIFYAKIFLNFKNKHF